MQFLNFLRRSALLIICTIATVYLSLNHAAFDALGPVIYVASMCSVAALLNRTYIAIHYSQTIDKEARHTGGIPSQYEREWAALDPRTRVILTVVTKAAALIGFCIIAASVGR